jgi:predicted anti-sigma-YlaC factor YlaD
VAAVLASVTLLVAGCSINQLAVRVLADTLAGGDGGGASVFTTDEDPELVGDALPFALKLYETILQQAPDHENLLFATGSGFISYANAFVATPASMLPFEEWELQVSEQQRAKALYLRGRDYLIYGMDIRYPGFRDALFARSTDELDTYLAECTPEDVGFLYWIAAGWVAAFSLDAFDLDLAFTVPRALTLAVRAVELDDGYSDGTIHDFLVQYYASVPATMGGDKDLAEYHHERALHYADGRLAGPYVGYAEALLIPRQDRERFVEYMETALAIDPEAYPDARLINVLSQRKAQWYLDHLDDFFLPDIDSLPGEEY